MNKEISFRQLEYFVAVAELLNFTKAAKACFISQTAISLQIKSLEEKVGTRLIERDMHHVKLTPAGKVYLQECYAILSRLEEASKLAKSATEAFSGTLCIGFIRGFEQGSLTSLLRGFKEKYPNINIRLVRDQMVGLKERLVNGECDLTFSLTPVTIPPDPGISDRVIKQYPLIVAMHPGHRLASQVTVNFEDLRGEDFVAIQPSGRPMEEMEEAILIYERAGYVPNIIRWSDEIQLILTEAAIGTGIAILPEYCVHFYRGSDVLAIKPLVNEKRQSEMVDFSVYWREQNQNECLDRFLKYLKSNA